MPTSLLCVAALLTMPQAQSPQSPAGRPTIPGATQPQLAGARDGAFIAVFLRNGNVGFARSGDGGATFSTPVVAIDAKGNARGGMQRGPRVAVDGEGTIYVTAPLCFDTEELGKRYPVNDLYLATSRDGGKTFTPPVRVNDVPKQAPEALQQLVAAPGAGAFVAWLDRRERKGPGQDLAFATLHGRGEGVAPNVVLGGPLCECCAPGVAMGPEGNPVLVWREGGDHRNRALWLATSTDRGRSFVAKTRLNRADSRVDG